MHLIYEDMLRSIIIGSVSAAWKKKQGERDMAGIGILTCPNATQNLGSSAVCPIAGNKRG
jgi:hypothetical protein